MRKILLVSDNLLPTLKITGLIPLEHLAAKSNNFEWRYRSRNQIDIKELHWADVIWFIRDCDLQSRNIAVWAKSLGITVMYDLDDSLGLIPTFEELGRVAFRENLKSQVAQMVAISNLTSVMSTQLAKDLNHLGKIRIRRQYQLVESNTKKYVLKKISTDLKTNDKELILLSPSTRLLNSAFLTAVAQELEKLAPDLSIELRTFSNSQSNSKKITKNFRITTLKPINNFREYLRFLAAQENTIGFAPLMSSKFNASKTEAKYRDFASSGIPGVYSDVLPYSAVIRHDSNGKLSTNDPRSWANHIFELHNDLTLKRQITLNAFNDILENYSIEKYVDALNSDFTELANQNKKTEIDPKYFRKENTLALSSSINLTTLPEDDFGIKVAKSLAEKYVGLVSYSDAPSPDRRINSFLVSSCQISQNTLASELGLEVLKIHESNCQCDNNKLTTKGDDLIYGLDLSSQIIVQAAEALCSKFVTTGLKQQKRLRRFRISSIGRFNSKIQNRIEIYKLKRS